MTLGAAPVVLVPPADPAEGGQIASAPIVIDQPVATQPAPVVKKKKTLLGLFKGTNDQVPAAQRGSRARLNSRLPPFPSRRPSSSQAAPTQGCKRRQRIFCPARLIQITGRSQHRVWPAESETRQHHWHPAIGHQSRHRWRQHPLPPGRWPRGIARPGHQDLQFAGRRRRTRLSCAQAIARTYQHHENSQLHQRM